MSHVAFTNLLNKLIQQRGNPPLNYEILIEQTINNEYLFHVNPEFARVQVNGNSLYFRME